MGSLCTLDFQIKPHQTVLLETYCCLVASEGLEVLDFLKLRADEGPYVADGLLQRKPSDLDALGVPLPLALLPTRLLWLPVFSLLPGLTMLIWLSKPLLSAYHSPGLCHTAVRERPEAHH